VIFQLVDILHLVNVECLRHMVQKRINLLPGTLDILILQSLRWGPPHGYGVEETIRTPSFELVQVESGSLYPVLDRLQERGWVRSRWKQTESKQRAKCDNPAAAGKKQLAAETARWEQIVPATAGVMNS
jgi:PadR family transcriptional regulator, regulatory protein PadR